MSKVIGIDLGTTNSCVAVVEGGVPVIIPNEKGERTTPSVIAFTESGERLVGSAARRQAAVNPERTVASIKRHMGTDWRKNLGGKMYSPQEISAMILRKLREDAQNYLGETITDAVITVPAYFNDIQRQATKDAGRIAGLNVLRIINEPTSAALAYGLNNGAAQKIMVYDLGGGTFDVSIIEIGDSVIEVLATAGDNHLGGDDFDERIVNHLVAECRQRQRVDLTRDTTAMVRLKEAAEQAKKELSATEAATISLPFITQHAGQPVHFEATLTRAKFNELTRDLVERTEGPVRSALNDAGIAASELGRVLLVGGSTRIPAVQEMVRRITGKEPAGTSTPTNALPRVPPCRVKPSPAPRPSPPARAFCCWTSRPCHWLLKPWAAWPPVWWKETPPCPSTIRRFSPPLRPSSPVWKFTSCRASAPWQGITRPSASSA